MKKIKMARGVTLTFEEGCELYLDSCRIRNLREGTINHYRQSYVQFYKFFDKDIILPSICKQKISKQKKRAPTSPQHLQYITKKSLCKYPI